MIKKIKWFLYKCSFLYLKEKEKEYFLKNSR